jgi:hypothetical protein
LKIAAEINSQTANAVAICEPDEASLLKCYDSKDDAPRESIEVRALVFWPAETA